MSNYVSRELAEKLKEAGFDDPCSAQYIKGLTEVVKTPYYENWNNSAGLSAPKIYEVIEWLDEKGIYINVGYNRYWYYSILSPRINKYDILPRIINLGGESFRSRVEAYIEGATFAVEYLIKNK
jgi:hypothetical protein